MKELTKKQKDFVLNWIEIGNKSEAYNLSYECSKMKRSTIGKNAYELSQLEHVRAYYDDLVKEREEEFCLDWRRSNELLLRIVEKGMRDDNLASSVSAIKEINKLNNLYKKDDKDKSLAPPVMNIYTVPPRERLTDEQWENWKIEHDWEDPPGYAE